MADKPKQLSINVSFKPSEKWLYDEISKHSSKGGFIKDILIKELKKDNRHESNENRNNKGDFEPPNDLFNL